MLERIPYEILGLKMQKTYYVAYDKGFRSNTLR